jgi:pyruvate dehydrogenase E1 component alpha subunit
MVLHDLYRWMARARVFELAVAELWREGRISGEMHASIGEEAVAVGVTAHLRSDDALALTHRSSAWIVARDVPLGLVVRELLGRRDGLGGGKAGHMHLFSRAHGIATTGIVGASLPLGAGFALALARQRPDAIGVAQTGDGALNQGMALETLNLAAAWRLPLVVVCIDNGWAINTEAGSVTVGDLTDRARAFGWDVAAIDGSDVEAVHDAAGMLIDRVREKRTPAFLHATCPRMAGHLLGDPLETLARAPLHDRGRVVALARGATTRGAGPRTRVAGMRRLMGTLRAARRSTRPGSRGDPIEIARRRLTDSGHPFDAIDEEVREEVHAVIDRATEVDDA